MDCTAAQASKIGSRPTDKMCRDHIAAGPIDTAHKNNLEFEMAALGTDCMAAEKKRDTLSPATDSH